MVTDDVQDSINRMKKKIRDIESNHNIDWDSLTNLMKDNDPPARDEKTGLKKGEITSLYYEGRDDISLPANIWNRQWNEHLKNNFKEGTSTVDVKYWVK